MKTWPALAGNAQINLSYAKLTNKEEEIMHILWKLKSVQKSDGGNNRRPAALQHFVDHRAQRRKKDTLHNAYGKRINTTPSLLSRTTEKGLWIRQLTIISSY
jgi:hypothetical protein